MCDHILVLILTALRYPIARHMPWPRVRLCVRPSVCHSGQTYHHASNAAR